jgi:hypothetical protein
VRHATQEDLDQVEALLLELRQLPQLRERKRGYFSRGSHAFLHFHEDAGDLYVDVRLDSAPAREGNQPRGAGRSSLTSAKNTPVGILTGPGAPGRHLGLGGEPDRRTPKYLVAS